MRSALIEATAVGGRSRLRARLGNAETAASVVLLVLFLVVLVTGRTYPADARLFPLIVGAVGTLLSASQLVMLASGRGRESRPPIDETEARQSLHTGRFWLGLLAPPVYSLAIWLIGFHAATLAVMLTIPPLLGFRRWPWLLVVAAGTLAVIHLTFQVAMQIELPLGIVGDALFHRFVYAD